GTIATRNDPRIADSICPPDVVSSATRSPARNPRCCNAPATRRCTASDAADVRTSITATPLPSAGEEVLGDAVVQGGIHQLQLADGLGKGDADDVTTAQRDHLSERPVVDGVDRRDAEAGGEHAVERRRCAAALHVTEDRHARLEPGAA